MANPNPDQSGLRPNKPGNALNPTGENGYTKRKRFTDALIKLLDERGLEDPFISAGMHAIKGDFNFWKYIYERIEGRLPDPEEQPELELKAFARKLKERKKKKE